MLTGGIKPHSRIMDLIRRSDIPVVSVPEDTYTVASKINNLIVKVRPGDKEKIAASEKLIAQYVDIDRIMDMLSGT